MRSYQISRKQRVNQIPPNITSSADSFLSQEAFRETPFCIILMAFPSDFTATVRSLTMKGFRDALTSDTLSYSEKRSRAKLEKTIYELPQSKQALLQGVAQDKKRRRLQNNNKETAGLSQPVNSLEDPFFQTVSKECRDCISKLSTLSGER